MLPENVQEFLQLFKEKRVSWGATAFHTVPQFRNNALVLMELPAAVFQDYIQTPQGIPPIMLMSAFIREAPVAGKQGSVLEDTPPWSPTMVWPAPYVNTATTSLSVRLREHQPRYFVGGTNPWAIADKSIRQIFDRWIDEAHAYDTRRFAPGGKPHIDTAGSLFIVFFTYDNTPNYVVHYKYTWPSQLSDVTVNPGQNLQEPLEYTITFRATIPEVVYSPEVPGEVPPVDELISQRLEQIIEGG